jgi:hypothetical protein
MARQRKRKRRQNFKVMEKIKTIENAASNRVDFVPDVRSSSVGDEGRSAAMKELDAIY